MIVPSPYGAILIPIGDPSLDDATQITAALRAQAYLGSVLLTRGNWYLKTHVDFVSGSQLIMGPGVVLDTTGAPVANAITDAAFRALAPAPSSTSLLNAASVVGSRAVVLAAGTIAQGSIVKLTSAAGAGGQVQVAKVQKAAGVNLTLDQPIVYPFQVGDHVEVLPSIVEDVHIFGNQAKVIGDGFTRFFAFFSTARCSVSEVDVRPTSGGMPDVVCTFAAGCQDCEFDQMQVSGVDALVNVTMVGLALQSANRCKVSGYLEQMGRAGVLVGSSVGFEVNVVVDDCPIGVSSTNLGAVVVGSSYGSIAGQVIGSSDVGVQVIGGSSHVEVEVDCLACRDAFVVGDASGVTSDVEISGTAVATTRNALAIAAGTLRTKARDLTGDVSITGTFLNLSADLDASAVEMTAGFAACTTTTSLRGTFRGCRFVQTLGEGTQFFNVQSGARCLLEECDLETNVGSNLTRTAAGSVLTVSKTRFVGADPGAVGMLATGGGCVRKGEGIDASGVTTPTAANTGGAFSWGQIVADNANPVAQAFTNMLSTDVITLTRVVDGGAPGNTPKVVTALGVGFNITADAGDTSTYEYAIT